VRALEDSLVWAIPRSQLALKLSQDVAFSSHFYRSLAVFLSDRLRKTVGRLGYEKNQHLASKDEDEEDLNPNLHGNLELAQARLDWLLNRLKTVH
jgi:CRP-like cAMP-binding protein